VLGIAPLFIVAENGDLYLARREVRFSCTDTEAFFGPAIS